MVKACIRTIDISDLVAKDLISFKDFADFVKAHIKGNKQAHAGDLKLVQVHREKNVLKLVFTHEVPIRYSKYLAKRAIRSTMGDVGGAIRITSNGNGCTVRLSTQAEQVDEE